MNALIILGKKKIQRLVDKVHGKPIDVAATILYGFTVLMTIYFIINLIKLTKYPIIKEPHSPLFFALTIALPISIFFITMAGDFFKKPSRRVEQFIFVIAATYIFALSYLIQVSNTGFVKMLFSIRNIEVIPYSLLEGNIKMITFFIPFLMVTPVAIATLKIISDKNIRNDLIEYEVDCLLPNVHKMDDTTIDIKICEDLRTGEECIVPEKITYEHTYLQGGTGSGKTATYIRPILNQLFTMKAKLREKQKELAFKCLEEGLAYLTIPVSNHWFNNNFTMELIKPVKGKEKEYLEIFKNYIIGVRDKETLVINQEGYPGGLLSFNAKLDVNTYNIDIAINKYGQEIVDKSFTLQPNILGSEIELNNDLKPIIIKRGIDSKDDEKRADNLFKNNNPLVNVNGDIIDGEERINIELPKLEDGISYSVKVKEKGNGKIIYKGLGTTVVAPDGELPQSTIEIAKMHGVKVYKIDPSMEEIRKGGVACFNPLIGGTPEKTGDIVSSILISMDQTEDAKGNAYFTNASVRAIRNIIILLKVMHERMYKEQPTLVEVLNILNDFKLVIPYVEEMKKDDYLKERWGSVIAYFEASFYSPLVDNSGRPVIGSSIGSQYKKTQEAISGIINQLDNFIGREEIRYILCNKKESLNLKEVLEKGECIAVSTRQSELGARLGKAFALFFILNMQTEILCRYSENENPEVPHHLIIDEFPMYVNEATETFFTFARKYKASITIAIQNMGQLKKVSDIFGETIFTNTTTKMLLPKSNIEDRKYWSEFFGIQEEIDIQTGINISGVASDRPSYSESIKGSMKEKKRVNEQEINDLNFKQAFYSYTDSKGRQRIGKGTTDFLKVKDKDKVNILHLDFEKFNRETLEEYYKRMKEEESRKEEIDISKHIESKSEIEITVPDDIGIVDNIIDSKDNIVIYEDTQNVSIQIQDSQMSELSDKKHIQADKGDKKIYKEMELNELLKSMSSPQVDNSIDAIDIKDREITKDADAPVLEIDLDIEVEGQ